MDFPTQMWYIDTLGSVKWIVSAHILPSCAEEDPLWILRSSVSLYIEDVEVMLVHGGWPDSSRAMNVEVPQGGNLHHFTQP